MSGRLCWWFSFSFDVLFLCSCTRMERSANSRGLWYDFIVHLSETLPYWKCLLVQIPNLFCTCLGKKFDLIYFSLTMTFDILLFLCIELKLCLLNFAKNECKMLYYFLNHFAEEPEKTNISPPTAQYMES